MVLEDLGWAASSFKPYLSSFGTVALNFQTAGEGMDLNDGLFSQNGCCGYVLKPSFMQQTKSGFDPESPQKQEDYQPVILNIQVETLPEERSVCMFCFALLSHLLYHICVS